MPFIDSFSAFDEHVFRVFLLKKGECIIAKFIHFPSLKSLVCRKQDVTSSTVSLEGKDTETMREGVECEIPADGECTTLLNYFEKIAHMSVV